MTDFKAPARIVDRQAGKAKVLNEGRCRLTGVTESLTRAHIISKAQGGHDLEDNIVPLTMSVHHEMDNGKLGKSLRRQLYSKLTERELEHVRARALELGWNFEARWLT